MASVNKTTLVGNLGADPDIRYMPDGTPTATLAIATTDALRISRNVTADFAPS